MSAAADRAWQARRDGLVALADYLTDQDDYEIPTAVLAALCPGVPDETRELHFEELLRESVKPSTWKNPFDTELALDYLTGER